MKNTNTKPLTDYACKLIEETNWDWLSDLSKANEAWSR